MDIFSCFGCSDACQGVPVLTVSKIQQDEQYIFGFLFAYDGENHGKDQEDGKNRQYDL
jgi:hypothetical protein